MPNLNGHDLSEYQAVKNYGGDFTIARLSEGVSYVDPLGLHHLDRGRKDGHLLGAYHYAVVADARKQAQLFAHQLHGQGPVLPFVDVESSAALPHNRPVAFVLDFLDELGHQTGVVGGAYLNASTVRAFDWSPVVRSGFHLWLAAWGPTMPATPSWAPILWQNGDGMGALDGDVFLGTRDEWQSLAAPRRAAPKAVPVKPAPARKVTRKAAAEYVTIRPGDTLSRIATAHHTTVAQLVKLNRVNNRNLIYAGGKLRVK